MAYLVYGQVFLRFFHLAAFMVGTGSSWSFS